MVIRTSLDLFWAIHSAREVSSDSKLRVEDESSGLTAEARDGGRSVRRARGALAPHPQDGVGWGGGCGWGAISD